MRITITVTDAELRGMPFRRYENALWSLLTGPERTAEVEIKYGHALGIVVEDDPHCTVDTADILELATELTHPDLVDAFEG